jgi:hypothetical protein
LGILSSSRILCSNASIMAADQFTFFNRLIRLRSRSASLTVIAPNVVCAHTIRIRECRDYQSTARKPTIFSRGMNCHSYLKSMEMDCRMCRS